jgi:hypothetical protein
MKVSIDTNIVVEGVTYEPVCTSPKEHQMTNYLYHVKNDGYCYTVCLSVQDGFTTVGLLVTEGHVFFGDPKFSHIGSQWQGGLATEMAGLEEEIADAIRRLDNPIADYIRSFL